MNCLHEVDHDANREHINFGIIEAFVIEYFRCDIVRCSNKPLLRIFVLKSVNVDSEAEIDDLALYYPFCSGVEHYLNRLVVLPLNSRLSGLCVPDLAR